MIFVIEKQIAKSAHFQGNSNSICERTSEQIGLRLFQPVEYILYAFCVKFLKKSDKRLLSKNFCKNLKRGRRGGPRHIWRSIVFEIYGNFEAHLLSALGEGTCSN